MMGPLRLVPGLALLAAIGPMRCASGTAAIPATEDWSRNIVATHVALDLAQGQAVATITLAGSRTSRGASFQVGDLEVLEVTSDRGPLAFRRVGRTMHVGLPAKPDEVTFTVRYRFTDQQRMQGWMAEQGVTFLWPSNCGNLYPCHPEPRDGVRVSFEVVGIPEGQRAIAPSAMETDGPSYMPAIAVGPYIEQSLGTTRAGTEVSVWFLPGGEAPALLGTRGLLPVFEFLETTYGPYAFGDKAGSVAVNWPGTSFAGMEHHPFWHVSADAMDNAYIHAHEAAHGWFGNGVRMACPEDFVLSEGLTTYAALRAMERATGAASWEGYQARVRRGCGDSTAAEIAMPNTCGQVDLASHPLASQATYVKGACFLHDVALAIGADELDAVLAGFYTAHVGRAAEMEALVASITSGHPAHAERVVSLAQEWLLTPGCPTDAALRCQSALP